MTATSRTERVLALCEGSLARLPPGEPHDRLSAIAVRLREPLRLVVAGRVNAGKSTLVNALLGRRIAPTDVSECTRVVTWFRFGFPETIEVIPRQGAPRRLAFDNGELPRHLGASPEEIDHVVVTLSNEALHELTIIDTPGLASANASLSVQTEELLAMTEASRRAASRADALVFVLTQTAREDDAAALEAFAQILGTTDSSPATAVGVLGKADKVGNGDPDVAAMIAGRLAAALRGRVATVVPVVSLVAETALCGRLSEHDASAIETLARMEAVRRSAAVRSVDLYRKLVPLPGEPAERLLTLLDLDGIKRAFQLVEDGKTGAGPLSDELAGLSGIAGLTQTLENIFLRHADTLKARTALADLEETSWLPAEADLAHELQSLRDLVEELRLEPDMHRIRELVALQHLARGVDLPPDLRADAERVAADDTASAKLGLPAAASDEQLEQAVLAGAQRWNSFRNDASVEQAEIAEVFCRSYALLWAEVVDDRRAATGSG
jgi:GTPase SAR1 family protein